MQDEPGTYELAVEVKQGEQAKQLSFNVLVAKEKFAVEHLTLPKDKVDLDEKSRGTLESRARTSTSRRLQRTRV